MITRQILFLLLSLRSYSALLFDKNDTWNNLYYPAYLPAIPSRYDRFNEALLGPYNAYEQPLHALMGNTIFAINVDIFKLWDSLEPHYKSAVYNGVLCDVTDQLEGKIMEIRVGNRNWRLLSEEREKEERYAKDPLIGIDCEASPDHCFCSEKKILLYCLALRMRQLVNDLKVTKKMCKSEVLSFIYPALFSYDVLSHGAGLRIGNSIAEKMKGTNISAVDSYFETIATGEYTRYSDRVLHRAYCNAGGTSSIGTMMKHIYASDGFFWRSETYFRAIYNEVKTGCKDPHFKRTKYGQCLCAFEHGINYCIMHVLGQYFFEIGYLDCGDARSFIIEKKPTELEWLEFTSHSDDQDPDEDNDVTNTHILQMQIDDFSLNNTVTPNETLQMSTEDVSPNDALQCCTMSAAVISLCYVMLH
ncbi:hypothetical protein PRIPAC_95352 [Pristionchus pacificus]|uniref:Uncharacterized protein n=1 Tax=Pristionchus pacificus TaxID=54126 RepID=A0A2A6B2U2_PRIPA|nr:hypothetical protein PRIPAC_95352 [Pristionchus pacificus]|eukprot:PDM60195.1 hypothetical protein PRIPAC_54020 [Pristionchus pacificus]